jgi:hypothetical protein
MSSDMPWDNQENLFEVDIVGIGNDKDYIVAPSVLGPKYGSKEWHEYIMSKFEPEELFDGNPTCAGLRRVVEEELGSIISSGPSEVFPSMDTNGPGRATVIYEIIIDWQNTGSYRTYKEVADVWHGNTDDLFCAHPVATASTRAEGRALRKALKVRCLAAEELAKKDIAAIVRQTVKIEGTTNGEITDKDKITTAQINFIDNKSKQLNLNVLSLINQYGVKNVNDLTKKNASEILQKLTEHQTGANKFPESFIGYNKDWRNA